MMYRPIDFQRTYYLDRVIEVGTRCRSCNGTRLRAMRFVI